MQFYEKNIYQILIFRLYTVYNKHEIIKIANQIREKSQVLYFIHTDEQCSYSEHAQGYSELQSKEYCSSNSDNTCDFSMVSLPIWIISYLL